MRKLDGSCLFAEKFKLSYRTKTCQNAALYTAGVCSDETAACLFLVFDKSVALHLVEIIESDTQSLPGFEFSIDLFLWNRKFPWPMWSRKAPFWILPRQLDISFCCYKSFEGQLSSVCKKKKLKKIKIAGLVGKLLTIQKKRQS